MKFNSEHLEKFVSGFLDRHESARSKPDTLSCTEHHQMMKGFGKRLIETFVSTHCKESESPLGWLVRQPATGQITYLRQKDVKSILADLGIDREPRKEDVCRVWGCKTAMPIYGDCSELEES